MPPDTSPAPPDQTPDPAPEPPAPSPPVAPPIVSQPKKRRLIGWLILLIIIVIAAGVAVAYHRKHHTQPAATKRDIPVVRYGLNTAELPDYPLNGGTVSNTDSEVNAQLFEGLVAYQDQTNVVPLLATSWSNPDDSTWVFNLRHGVMFHSGRTMTATDVKYTLDYAIVHQNDVNGSTFSLLSTIKEVDVINPYEVKIITNGPDPVLLNRLTNIGIVDSKAALGDYNAGTGPYVIKPGTKPTKSSIDLAAYNGYWGGHVYTRELDFSASTSTDTLAAEVKSGQIDLSGNFTTKELSTIKHYQPVNVLNLGINFLGLNTEKAGSPLQSLAARQAAAYALNIPAIIKASGLEGQQANQLVPTAIPGHDPSITNWPYDPAKAKQLLSTVSNAKAPLTLGYPPSDPGVPEMAKELNAVGFNVQSVEVPNLDTLVQEALGGQFDMYFLAYTSNTLDGLDVLSSLLQGNSDYDNAQIDSLSTQAGAILDPASRIKLLQQMAQIVHANVPDIPVYSAIYVYALNKPYKVTVDIPSSDAGIYFWKVYQQ